jgi:ABC-type multidrug transport system fused ATPase/permease subunit
MLILLRLLTFVRPYKKLTALVLTSTILTGIFLMLTPQIIQWTLDNTNLSQGKLEIGTLLLAGLAILITSMMRGVFYYLQQYEGERLSQQIAYDLRNEIYDRLQRLSFAYHDKAQIGQIMSRATQDVEGVRFYINMGVIRLIYTLGLIIIAFVLMAITNWHLALVSCAVLPFIAAQSIYTQSKMRPMWLNVQDGMGRMGTVLQENLSGVRVVKAFSREEFESKKFKKDVDYLFDWSFATNRLQAWNQPMLVGLGALASVFAVWYGGHLVVDGQLKIGELTAFLIYLTVLQLPVRSLGFVITILARAQSSGERIFEIIDAESAVKEKPNPVELNDVRGEVTFDHVAFGYDSVSAVLKDVSLDAKPGEMIALLGPTGTMSPAAVSRSTGTISATSRSPRCAARSASCNRMSSCSWTRSARTSATRGWAQQTKTSKTPPRSPASTTSS